MSRPFLNSIFNFVSKLAILCGEIVVYFHLPVSNRRNGHPDPDGSGRPYAYIVTRFGKTEVFDNILRIYLAFGKSLMLLCEIIIVEEVKRSTIYFAVWSH